MSFDLSEYEKKRLENIRHNKQLLQSLSIPKLADAPTINVKTRSVVPNVTKIVQERSRRSSRLIEKQYGVRVKEEPTVVAEKKPRVPRITKHTLVEPQIGATQDFLALTSCIQPCIPNKLDSVQDLGLKYHLRDEKSILKVSRDRIYSMAINPTTDCLLSCAGTKEGDLAFWNASNEEQCFIFTPHSAPISNLKYLNPMKLLTTGYDGSCLTMDLSTGTFDPWFLMGSKEEAVVTGFDVSGDGRSAYHSDTSGMFRLSDLRSNKVVNAVQLHHQKIGGLSVSSDTYTLGTCSNDRSICLWDLRSLTKPLAQEQYKNAVTAINFHPSSPDVYCSTCYDDFVRVHTPTGTKALEHNNQTGRWITLFKAIFDPKSTPSHSLVLIGNMESRGVDLIDGVRGEYVGCITSPYVTAQPAVNAVHPALNVIFSGNASGKIALWTL